MPQRLLSRLRARCAADERLASAMLYGSFAHGEADAWSDLDVVLFFRDERRADVDPREWLEGVAPLRLLSVNEFGNHAAIFEGLVRGEFHFEREGDVEQLLAWGRDLFPSIASTVLLDRSGRLTGVVAQLVGTPAPAAYRRLVPQLGLDLATWGLLAVQVLERGEHVRAAELVGGLLHRDLLRLVRLREGVDPRWRQPRRRLERELSTEARERFLRTCVPGPSVPATRVALAATLGWAMELLAVLDGGGEHEYDGVLEELVRRLEAA